MRLNSRCFIQLRRLYVIPIVDTEESIPMRSTLRSSNRKLSILLLVVRIMLIFIYTRVGSRVIIGLTEVIISFVWILITQTN